MFMSPMIGDLKLRKRTMSNVESSSFDRILSAYVFDRHRGPGQSFLNPTLTRTLGGLEKCSLISTHAFG